MARRAGKLRLLANPAICRIWTARVCGPHEAPRGRFFPSELAVKPWQPIVMAADAFALGQPRADLDHIGKRALAEPTNFGRMLGEDGIGCDGACRCGTRSATGYLHFCLLVAWRPRTTKWAKPRWSTSGASTVSGGFGCGVGFALMSPVGSGLDADQRAPSDRHLARTASFLFQLEKERLRDVVRDAEGFDRVSAGRDRADGFVEVALRFLAGDLSARLRLLCRVDFGLRLRPQGSRCR